MKKMSEPAKKDDRIYTYADYCRWPDDERWELIDGVAYNMSPAPGRQHQEISGEIFAAIHSFLKDKPCRVYAAPFDVRLPEHARQEDDEITTVVQPDVSVFCNKEYLDEHGAVGPPDIAVEILSPYTSVKDQREKLELYERFGVTEYWIVDPANRVMWVYRLGGFAAPSRIERTGARNSGRVQSGEAESTGHEEAAAQRAGGHGRPEGYGRPPVYGPEDTFSTRVLDGFSLQLNEVFG
jgi:Uma2 family endonuclease